MFTVHAKAMKHHITQAVKKLYDTAGARVNTLTKHEAGKAYDHWLLHVMLGVWPTKLRPFQVSLAG